MQSEFVHSQYFVVIQYQIYNSLIIQLMSLAPLKCPKFKIFVKLLIYSYHFIGITSSKPHLVCTFYDKQINTKKYEWKFESVQVLLVGDYTVI